MQRTIEITSQLSRAAREAAAAVLGQRRIFRTLKGEHAEVKTLALRCARTQASGRGLRLRRELFGRMRAELLAHLETEERELYSVLMQHELTRAEAARSLERHHRLELRLQELSLLRLDAPEWIRRFDELERELSLHLEEEEKQLFPLAARALTPERARQINRRFRVEKTRALRRLEVDLH